MQFWLAWSRVETRSSLLAGEKSHFFPFLELSPNANVLVGKPGLIEAFPYQLTWLWSFLGLLFLNLNQKSTDELGQSLKSHRRRDTPSNSCAKNQGQKLPNTIQPLSSPTPQIICGNSLPSTAGRALGNEVGGGFSIVSSAPWRDPGWPRPS